MDIIFAGTPDFSVPPLTALLGSEHRVVAVYTQPDRPAGRGRKLSASPVKQLALQHSIPLFQPNNFREDADLQQLEQLGADLMVVVAYGLLLPVRVLEAPRLGCINIHASLLPRWRGAAPIQRSILAGDSETGITIMEMEAGLDSGPMLLKKSCPIGPDDTGGILHDRLSSLGAEALLQALPGIAAGSLRAQLQNESEVVYAAKLNKSEAVMDWTLSAQQLGRQVRAFNPWPVAQTSLADKVLRIWEAEPLQAGVAALPGTVTACSHDGIDVATGDGCLRIKRLQLPGKRAMHAADFLHAHTLHGVMLG
ncbi:MAG: methionyl-tRNA formyltransferase [Gammaproteobacteria bacterium]